MVRNQFVFIFTDNRAMTTIPLSGEGDQNSTDDQNSGSGSGQEDGDQNSPDEEKPRSLRIIFLDAVLSVLFLVLLVTCSIFATKKYLNIAGKNFSIDCTV